VRPQSGCLATRPGSQPSRQPDRTDFRSDGKRQRAIVGGDVASADPETESDQPASADAGSHRLLKVARLAAPLCCAQRGSAQPAPRCAVRRRGGVSYSSVTEPRRGDPARRRLRAWVRAAAPEARPRPLRSPRSTRRRTQRRLMMTPWTEGVGRPASVSPRRRLAVPRGGSRECAGRGGQPSVRADVRSAGGEAELDEAAYATPATSL